MLIVKSLHFLLRMFFGLFMILSCSDVFFINQYITDIKLLDATPKAFIVSKLNDKFFYALPFLTSRKLNDLLYGKINSGTLFLIVNISFWLYATIS